MLCIQKGEISPMSLHSAASVIQHFRTQLVLCIQKKLQYRPLSLHIAASTISQGHSWCCVFKMVQYNDNAYNNNNNNEVNMTRMSV